MSRFVEDMALALVIHADENAMTLDEGFALAEEVYDLASNWMQDREDYVPGGPVPEREG